MIGRALIAWLTILTVVLWASPVGELVADEADLDLGKLVRIGRIGKLAYDIDAARGRMTPEDEYHFGRAATARLLSKYPPAEDSVAIAYLNRVGQALTLASKRPQVFDGYRFILLDSAEVNAFAVPGAFVLITRGMLRLAEDEDMLVAILAHEIAHIQEHHGRHLIKERPWRKFWKLALDEAFAELTGSVLGDLSRGLGVFAGEYYEIITRRGYAKEQEREADQIAVRLLRETGYDPRALVEMLGAIETKKADFAKTHPKIKKRIRWARQLAGEGSPRPQVRQQRFLEATAGVRGQGT